MSDNFQIGDIVRIKTSYGIEEHKIVGYDMDDFILDNGMILPEQSLSLVKRGDN